MNDSISTSKNNSILGWLQKFNEPSKQAQLDFTKLELRARRNWFNNGHTISIQSSDSRWCRFMTACFPNAVKASKDKALELIKQEIANKFGDDNSEIFTFACTTPRDHEYRRLDSSSSSLGGVVLTFVANQNTDKAEHNDQKKEIAQKKIEYLKQLDVAEQSDDNAQISNFQNALKTVDSAAEELHCRGRKNIASLYLEAAAAYAQGDEKHGNWLKTQANHSW